MRFGENCWIEAQDVDNADSDMVALFVICLILYSYVYTAVPN